MLILHNYKDMASEQHSEVPIKGGNYIKQLSNEQLLKVYASFLDPTSEWRSHNDRRQYLLEMEERGIDDEAKQRLLLAIQTTKQNTARTLH